LSGCGLVLVAGIILYGHLESDFLPELDEGGFVIDYHTPYGTSLTETNRQLLKAEEILRATPEVESYSRRTGARLALAIAEPNTGDFLVKLKPDRHRRTQDVIADLRAKFHVAIPGTEWDFPGILTDLIGDLTWSPQPIEVKVFSTDVEFLKKEGREIAEQLKQVKGVVDVFDGLVFTGPTLSLRVHSLISQRFGIAASDVAGAVSTAMLGQLASSVLEGDRVINIRVRVDGTSIGEVATLRELPLRTADGSLVKLSQVADVVETPGQLELRREDLRQDVPRRRASKVAISAAPWRRFVTSWARTSRCRRRRSNLEASISSSRNRSAICCSSWPWPFCSSLPYCRSSSALSTNPSPLCSVPRSHCLARLWRFGSPERP
jgi:Cu/Ag efflux pump CusA